MSRSDEAGAVVPWWRDAGLAGLLSVAETVLLATTTPGPSGPHVAAVALVGPLALVARRRRPVPVLAATVASAAATAMLWSGEPVGQVCVAVALYHVGSASTRRRHQFAAWMAVTAVLAAVTALLMSKVAGPRVVVLLVAVLSALAGVALVQGARAGRRQRAVRAEVEAARAEVRAAERRAESAGRAERERLALELHDVVTHAATASVVQARLAAATLLAEPDTARQALTAIERTGTLALRELRAVLGSLAATDAATDAPDLDTLLRDDPVRTTVHRSGTAAPMADQVAHHLYRVVQEALTNARRHGSRPEATVTIDHLPDTVTVTVTNPAPPCPVTTADGESGLGLGLNGMRQRVALARGTLRVVRTVDAFTVQVTVPRAVS